VYDARSWKKPKKVEVNLHFLCKVRRDFDGEALILSAGLALEVVFPDLRVVN
jgi:hypothetical protein